MRDDSQSYLYRSQYGQYLATIELGTDRIGHDQAGVVAIDMLVEYSGETAGII